jgi:hypothetical protein
MIKAFLTFESGISIKVNIREKDYKKFLKESKINERSFLKRLKAFLRSKGFIKK